MLPAMYRRLLLALTLLALMGCATAQPAPITEAIQGNLESLQLLEKQMLELVPNGDPIDFGQVGGDGDEVLYRPRDGWRILLRSYQVRAASLVAWANGEEFDKDTATQALVIPAIREAQKNLKNE